MTSFLFAISVAFIFAALIFIMSKITYFHEVEKSMLNEISNRVIEESGDLKKKINTLFDLIDEIREDMKKSSVVKENLTAQTKTREPSSYLRSDDLKKKLSDKRKAWWAAKKAGELNKSAPGIDVIPLTQQATPKV